MKIFIKTLKASWLVEVSSNDSIHSLKQLIDNKYGIPIEKQKLYYVYKELEDKDLIRDIGIREYCTIYVYTKEKYENIKLFKEKYSKKK